MTVETQETEYTPFADQEPAKGQDDYLIMALIADGWSQEAAEATVADFLALAEEDCKDPAAPIDKTFANWIVGKVADAESEIDSIKEMFVDEMARLQRRFDTLKRTAQRRLDFLKWRYEDQLREFAAASIAGKKESVALLRCRIGFRKSQEKLVFDVSEEAALHDLFEQGFSSCIYTKDFIDKEQLASLLKDDKVTGEAKQDLCRIAHIEPAEDKFYITPEKR